MIGGFLRRGTYHQAEDVQEAADQEDIAGAEVIVELADDGTAEKHEECFEGDDP